MAGNAKRVSTDAADVVVTFSTRISLETRRTIEQTIAAKDLSIRQVIELAVAQTWGSGVDLEAKAS